MPRLHAILLRSDLSGAPVAAPAPAAADPKEPLFALGGFTGLGYTGTPAAELAIRIGPAGAGGAYVPLVSATRQVELVGAQAITGRKTFSLGSISITGGAADQVLRTDGAGNLTWVAQASGGAIYTFARGLTEETGNVVNLDFAGQAAGNLGGVFVPPVSGLILGANGQLTLDTATATQLGGVTVLANGGIAQTGAAIRTDPALMAEAIAGNDNAKPITAQVLQLGANPSTLLTSVKTIVPAINEIAQILGSITGLLTIVGTFNATTGVVTPITGSPLAPGPLPPATDAVWRAGMFLLVNTAGTPPPPAPNVPMVVNDMIIVVENPLGSGTLAFAHVSLGQAVIAASNVTVTAIPGLPGANVQVALQNLQLQKLDGPLWLDTSLQGDGSQQNPLGVAIVDGGTF